MNKFRTVVSVIVMVITAIVGFFIGASLGDALGGAILFALIAGWSIVWYRCRMTADPPALLEASPVILDIHTSGNDRFFFRIRIFEWEEFFSILFIPLR